MKNDEDDNDDDVDDEDDDEEAIGSSRRARAGRTSNKAAGGARAGARASKRPSKGKKRKKSEASDDEEVLGCASAPCSLLMFKETGWYSSGPRVLSRESYESVTRNVRALISEQDRLVSAHEHKRRWTDAYLDPTSDMPFQLLSAPFHPNLLRGCPGLLILDSLIP